MAKQVIALSSIIKLYTLTNLVLFKACYSLSISTIERTGMEEKFNVDCILKWNYLINTSQTNMQHQNTAIFWKLHFSKFWDAIL